MIDTKKTDFLRKYYTEMLREIDPSTRQLWGKMNFQQMVEHMSDYVRIGSGKDPQQLIIPVEQLPKTLAFLASDKPFKENTPNALMPDTPPEVRHTTIEAAINELQYELDYFFEAFERNPDLKVTTPFFGDLDFEMSVQLLYKHAWHHLKQFGISE